MVGFTSTSILFIAIAQLLIERESRKHVNIDLIKTKLILVLTHDVTVDFGESLANNSLSFETKILYSRPIALGLVNVNGIELACSTSKILLL